MILHPSITINNITYTGDHLDGKELEAAICDAYREAPDECTMAYMIVDVDKGIVEDMSPNKMPTDPDLLYEKAQADSKLNWLNGEKLHRNHVVGLIAIIILMNLVVLVIVRRKMKRQMREQVSSQV